MEFGFIQFELRGNRLIFEHRNDRGLKFSGINRLSGYFFLSLTEGEIPKKGNATEYSNYRTIALIAHASKVMLKILQARLQQYVNHELPDVQAGFRKGRGTRSNCQHLLDH